MTKCGIYFKLNATDIAFQDYIHLYIQFHKRMLTKSAPMDIIPLLRSKFGIFKKPAF